MEGGDEEAFNTEKIDLRYTPRQMTLLSATIGGPTTGANAVENRKILLAVVESDYNDYGLEAKKAMGFDLTGEKGSSKKADKANDDSMDMDEGSDDEEADKKEKEESEGDEEDAEEKEVRKTPIRGPIPPGPGHWGSCVRLLDPSDSCKTLDCVEMNRNEAALCCASVRFHSKGGEPLLAVGTVSNMTMNPLRQQASHIILYRVVNGDRLQLLHRTTVDDGPVLALAHFQGRLLVGIGKSLKLYEMGKRQLLRKSELRGLPTYVKTLQTAGDRYVNNGSIHSFSILVPKTYTTLLHFLYGTERFWAT
jgi:splicing factor 3B subunit 3